MLSELRCWADGRRRTVVTDRPARHFKWSTSWMLHHLHNAAAIEALFLLQFLGIEYGAGRHPGRAEHAHRLVLVALPGPSGNHGIDFGLLIGSRYHGVKARIADEIGPTNDLKQRAPMRRIGAAGVDIDIIVGPAGFARIDAAWHRTSGNDFSPIAGDGLTAGRVSCQCHANVLQHRILHSEFDTLASTGIATPIKRCQDTDSKQHP